MGIPRKQVGRLLLQKKRKECSASNPLMRELDEFTEAFGDNGYAKMVLENFNDEAQLEKGSAVQKLSDSWEDWESVAIVESLEKPWRVVESESYDGESFDSVLIKSDDEDKTGLVMSHDGSEGSEYMNSETDPTLILNCMELTLFGEKDELKRGSLEIQGWED